MQNATLLFSTLPLFWGIGENRYDWEEPSLGSGTAWLYSGMHSLSYILFGLLASLLVASSLVIHEIGHWAAAARVNVPILEFSLGLGPRLFRLGRFSVRLFPIGAALLPDPVRFQALAPRHHLVIALAGPVASLAAWAAFSLAAGELTGKGQQALSMLADLNFMLFAFNLLPIPPLDGWLALSALADTLDSPVPQYVQRIAHRVGQGVIYGIGAWVLLRLAAGQL